jgi:heat-inducible transcriptional repressor
MMSERQQQILRAIVEQYAEVASPVGSSLLAKVFNVSSATVRSEMVELERLGYIKQPHTSAGRIPTDKGYRVYVNWLQSNEDKPEISRAGRAIERQIQHSGEDEQAVKNAVQALALATNNLSIGFWKNRTYQYGLPSLFQHPEFFGGREAFSIAQLVERLPELIQQIYDDDNRVTVYIGQENPIGRSAGASSIIGRVNSPDGQSFVGVVGPTRQHYGQVVGLVDYVSRTLEKSLNG